MDYNMVLPVLQIGAPVAQIAALGRFLGKGEELLVQVDIVVGVGGEVALGTAAVGSVALVAEGAVGLQYLASSCFALLP